MINVTDPSKCCGCSACVSSCPVGCIVMTRDQEGFDYPIANADLCVGCGKCDSICPIINPKDAVEPISAYAVRFDDYLACSSSGGVFPALASSVLNEGGCVFGAVLESDLKVGHAEASDVADLDAMRGSKYVQSDLYSLFEDIREKLDSKGKVLFSGTPCQVAGLSSFLGKSYDELLTVDIACHGVPAPGLWERYVNALEKGAGKKITHVNFRDKSRSWRHYGMSIKFNDGTVSYSRRDKDPYLSLFLQNMTLRPSCYECRFRCGSSGSDITLSDLWSVPDLVPQLNDDKGVSGVFVNTEKGAAAFAKLLPEFVQEVDKTKARSCNSGFSASIEAPAAREAFFKGAHLTPDIVAHMKKYVVAEPVTRRLWRTVRSMLSKLKRRMLV